MTGRAFAALAALCLGASSAVAMGSCSSTTTLVPTGIDEPPTIRIVSPVDGDCVAIPDTATAFVPLTVDVAGSFYLRPPGLACANTYNCGYLQLFIDNAPNNTSATATIDANFGSLANKYGTFTLTVELVWDLNDGGGNDIFDAQVYYDGSAPPDTGVTADASGIGTSPPTGFYQASVTIRTAPSCGDSGGGTGGATGTGGSKSGTGGTGGSKSGGTGGAGGVPNDAGNDAASSDAGNDASPSDAGVGDASATDAGPADASASG